MLVVHLKVKNSPASYTSGDGLNRGEEIASCCSKDKVYKEKKEDVDAIPKVQPEERNEVSFFATEPILHTSTEAADFTATDIILASQRAARLRAEMGYPDKNVSKESLPTTNGNDFYTTSKLEQDPQQAFVDTRETDRFSEDQDPETARAEKSCSIDNGNSDCSPQDLRPTAEHEVSHATEKPLDSQIDENAQTPTSIKAPTPPPGASPTKRRPPALAPQPSYRQPATKPVAKPGAKATRCGGGFGGLVQHPHKPKSKAKAKAKPQEKDNVKNPSEVIEPEAEIETPIVKLEEAPIVEEPDVAVNESSTPLTPEEQKESIERAMTCADHFLGLLKFDRAADKLEKQLSMLADESCAHHHSALHVDVMEKYGGVLWWDGDPEGAIDAYTAAEEILIEKPRDDWQVKRRTDIWLQAAQVCRGCGDLDSADEQLSQAIYCLTELVEKSECKNTEYADSLREAQAALGQVCVEKKEFERAEEFYLAAFGTDSLDENATRHEDGKTTETGCHAESPRD